MKICPVGAELFHADGWTDGQTDITKLIVTFAILQKRLKTIDTYIVIDNEVKMTVDTCCSSSKEQPHNSAYQ
jgi:hypothetical protein